MKICDVEDQLCLFDPDGSAGKTCRVCSAAVHPSMKTSGSSSKRSRELYAIPYLSLDLTPGHGNMLGEPTWELNSPWLGGSLMLNTGPAPLNGGGVSSLSQILVDAPPLKYYLSRRACRGVLRRMVKRGKPQPFSLVLALVIQGALIPRNRVPELLSLILSAQENEETCMILDHGEEDDAPENHRVFAAGFSAGAGASAGSIGYSEQVAPTLKGSPSGNCMPSVLCLNDQGGDIMECSVNISGTLRAQEHGHQPLVFENHGIDVRYRGPLSVSPTLAARAGTGGNNLPLVEQPRAVDFPNNRPTFSMQRSDCYDKTDVASTECARQHKGPTDLVLQPYAEEMDDLLIRMNWDHVDDQYEVPDMEDPGYPLLIRRLMPIECERLMGFPDGWTNVPGASDSVRYMALGNSVATTCAEYVLRGIMMAAELEELNL